MFRKSLKPTGAFLFGIDNDLHTSFTRSGGRNVSLGAQAGQYRIHNVANRGGFTRFRHTAQRAPFEPRNRPWVCICGSVMDAIPDVVGTRWSVYSAGQKPLSRGIVSLSH